MREFWDKGTIEVAKSQKAAYILDRGWNWPFDNAFHFDRVHFDLAMAYDNSKAFDLFLVEATLFWFEEKIVFGQFIEEVIDFLCVFLFVVPCGYDCIIHVYMKPSLSNFFLENVVHHCLKGGWGVCQAKEHHCRFK